MDGETQCYQDVNSSQFRLKIQCNSNQNPSGLFCGYGQTDSGVYAETQNTQNSQHNVERQNRSWGTAVSRFPGVLQSCRREDRQVLSGATREGTRPLPRVNGHRSSACRPPSALP